MPFPYIALPDDDPEIRGKIHGGSVSHQIGRNIASCYRRFERNGLDRTAARRQAAACLESIAGEEQYLREMLAIAASAELDALDVAVVNLRIEIGFPLLARRALAEGANAALVEGCTSFGLLAESTKDGHVKLGQTLDGIAAISGNLVIIRNQRPNGSIILGLHEAGSVGPSVGLSSSGLGVVYNSLISPACSAASAGLPFRLRVLAILDADNFAEALGRAVEMRRPTAMNLLLGHRDGEIVDLEMTQDAATYLYPQRGVITHANHFEKMPGVTSLFERLLPDSIFRGERLRRVLSRHTGSIDDRLIESALTDHFSFPFSICHHGNETSPPEGRAMTLAGVVLDLTTGTLAATDGPPCANPFQRFNLLAGQVCE
jgi:isopenicillin-N N-acyltransferase like protein